MTNSMDTSGNCPDDTGKKMLDALQAANTYLAMIHSRIETLLHTEIPEYVKSDLALVYRAEQEVSQIVRSMTIFCHKHL